MSRTTEMQSHARSREAGLMEPRVIVYGGYEPRFQEVYDVFRETLQDDLDLRIRCYDVEGDMSWRTPAFSQLNLMFWEEALLGLKVARSNDLICVMDVDIDFFKPVLPVIWDCIAGKDILVLHEFLVNDDINTGIVVMRPVPAVIGFLDAAMVVWRSDPTMCFQWYVQDQLRKNECPVSWDFLPRSFYCWTTNPGCPPDDEIVLHHANGSSGAGAKLQQFAGIRFVLRTRGLS